MRTDQTAHKCLACIVMILAVCHAQPAHADLSPPTSAEAKAHND